MIKGKHLVNYFTTIVTVMVLFVISNLFGANPSDTQQATQPVSAESVNTLSWIWNMSGQLNGWTIGRANSYEVSSEGLKINTGSDFNLVSPAINVNARNYRYVAFRIKSDFSDDGEIFFTPEGKTGFSQQLSIPFHIIGDNKFHTYLVDMTKNPKWLGQINRLRLDAVSLPEINIQIKELGLLEKADSKEEYVRQCNLEGIFQRCAGPSSAIHINSEEQFFNALNLDLPGMEAVKAAVVAKDWPAAKKALLEHMRNRTTPRYIVDRHDRVRYVEQAKKEFPGSAIEGAIKNADLICNHDFTFEGFSHKFDGPVVWYNTKSGTSFVYNAHLNRMLYLNDIGRAYWLTGNSKYAKAACDLIDSWISSSPLPPEIRRTWLGRHEPDEACAVGNPWGGTLQIGQRLTSWTAFNEYFVDSPEMTPEFYYRFMVSLLEQARYMYAIESMGFCGGNWAIIECGGLAQAAIMFPEFKESSEWYSKVKQLTKLQMLETVFPDGVQVERSPGYHTWCYTQFNNLLLLATLNNVELPKGFAQTVKAMYEYLHYKIAYPDRKAYPALADGSGVIWWSNNNKVYDRLTGLNLSNFWNIGLEPYEALKKFEKTTPPYTSTELTSAGFYMMRSGWGDKERFLLFDCGLPSTAGGHYHNSAMNVDIYAFGRPLIVDPGIRGYNDYSYLDYYRRVRAHNIIEFASEENRQDPKLIRWLRSKDFCFAEGTVACLSGSTMTRKVLFVGGDYWVVDDFVRIGSSFWNPCVTRAYWHLNSQSVVVDGQQVQLASADDEGYTRRSWKGGNGRDLSFYTDDANTGNILLIPDGKIDRFTLCNDTPCYGYVASYRQIAAPPSDMGIRYATLLYPFEGTKRPDVSFKDGVVKIGQNREGLYMRKGERTDGDCAFVGKEDGAINRILLVAGSRVSDAVQLDVFADFMIVTRQGESLDIQLMESSSKKVNRIELSGLQGVNKVTVNGKTCKIFETDGKLVIVGPFEKISPNPDNPDLFWIVK